MAWGSCLSRWVGPGVSPLFGRPYDRCGDTGGNQGLQINLDFWELRRVGFPSHKRFFFGLSFSHRLLSARRKAHFFRHYARRDYPAIDYMEAESLWRGSQSSQSIRLVFHRGSSYLGMAMLEDHSPFRATANGCWSTTWRASSSPAWSRRPAQYG